MVLFERKTILRGWKVCTLLIIPFTFIPTLFKYGFSSQRILDRFPDALLYSSLFALMVVGAVLIHNYNALVDRKSLFDRPTFEALEFRGMLDGVGSIVQELESFLFGQVGSFYYRISILESESDIASIQIIPFLAIEGLVDLSEDFEKLGFQNLRYFGPVLELSETQLEDPDYLRGRLDQLSEDLERIGAVPYDLDTHFQRDFE